MILKNTTEDDNFTQEIDGLTQQGMERLISGPVQGWVEKVVHINRCAKVVKGGRRFSFAVLVVAGDRNGMIGIGHGKAKEVADAIRKASEASKKRVFQIALKDGTIPHDVIGVADGGRVVLRPASQGTGVVAGGGVRAVLEVLGVKDVLSKSLGSNNDISMVRATVDALLKLRTREQVYALRKSAGDVLSA